MKSFRLVASIITLAFLAFVSPAQSAVETGATPPAADETLIYVMRVGRFAGGGGSMWVAVNDQTVDRLKNKGYAVVRAKAGRITLSIANAGMIFSAIALDDRPGETLYLKWRVGDLNLREVSEAEGREFLRKSKRTRGIEAPLGNDEEIDVLANLSRMGFNLTRPASRNFDADSEHGVITFFRRKDGRNLELGIWGDQSFVSTLGIQEGIRWRVPAGKHHFLSANRGASILRAEVEAGMEYFVWLDYGEGFGGVRLTPISLKSVANLKKWLEVISWVELDSDAVTSRIRERGDVVREFMQAAISNPGQRRSNVQTLGRDHAFDSAVIEAHQIAALTNKKYLQQVAKVGQVPNQVDISGKYFSEISGDKRNYFGRSRIRLELTQDGNSFNGSIASEKMRGEVWGSISGHTVKFKWFTDGGANGVGKWKIDEVGSLLRGSWQSDGARVYGGEWNLRLVE